MAMSFSKSSLKVCVISAQPVVGGGALYEVRGETA